MKKLYCKKYLIIVTLIFLIISALILVYGCKDNKSNKTFTLTYSAQMGGSIEGEATQTVNSGEKGLEIKAIPNEGYEFVKWSDEVMTAIRTDTNVTSDLTVTAIFEKLKFNLRYETGLNGRLVGESNQIVEYGEDGTEVKAVPNEGYKFVKWTDNVTKSFRTDTNITSNKTVTALFERLTYNLFYKTDGNGTLEGETTQKIDYGGNGTKVIAVPMEGYEFVKWSDNLSNSTRQDTGVKSDKIVTAIFKKKTFNLTYATDGNGRIEGEANQTVEYGENGTIVTAVPNTGYEFVKWSDGITDITRTDTNILADKSVVAKFARRTLTVKYETNGNGIIEGETIQKIIFAENGTEVAAIPDEGYKFVKWSDEQTTSKRLDRYVLSDRTITAIFAKISFNITYKTDGHGIIVGEETQTVEYGADCTEVTAVPNEGYEFVKWSDNVTDAVRTDTNIFENKTITATFSEIVFTVNYEVEGNGRIRGETTQLIPYNGNGTTVTAIAAEGNKFITWSDGLQRTYREDTNVTSDLTFTAIFEKRTFTVTYQADSNGTIEGEAIQTVAYGESSISVTAVPNEGYRFVRWLDGVDSAERSDSNITVDKNYMAIFEKITFPVKYETNGYGSISYNTGYRPNVGYGEESAVTAKPKSGYQFLYWSDGVETASRREIITSELSVVAYFGYIITYVVDEDIGGSITGECTQKLIPEASAEEVTAVADDGYVFAGWSDMSLSLKRQDVAVMERKYIAYFELIEKTFNYDYGDKYSAPLTTSVTINRFKLEEVQFVMPEIENYKFCGWYLDSGYNTRIVNEYGKLMLGYYTFVVETDTIYAKWQKADEDIITYNVLNVIVDEAHASLYSSVTEDYVAVDYKMSAIERKLFSLYANKMQECINEWFEGKVVFEFDNYFTTKSIGAESFGCGLTSSRNYSYHIFADDIPEVEYLLNDYHCMMTIAGMSDYDGILHFEAGTAGAKYAMLHIEQLIDAWINNIPKMYEEFKCNSKERWDLFTAHYFHEFTHTVESRYDYKVIYDFHKVQGIYINNQLEGAMLYLLGKAVAEDELVGVPQSYWEDPANWEYGYGQLH